MRVTEEAHRPASAEPRREHPAHAAERLIAQNEALEERLRRLGPVLRGLVHDLTRARRENASLRRENVLLQAIVAGFEGASAGVADHARERS